MTQPEKPYFCRSNMSDQDTECYPTEEDAISAAEQARMAPFTVFRLFAQPIRHKMTNGNVDRAERLNEKLRPEENAVT